jgi:predicted phosphodiesterase
MTASSNSDLQNPSITSGKKRKVWILSDLHHYAHSKLFLPDHKPAHDICILAGDIHDSVERAISYGEQLTEQPVVLVAGNHEFYHSVIDKQIKTGNQHYQLHHDQNSDAAAPIALQSNVRFLENTTCVIDDIRIIGCTLWVDFDLYGPNRRVESMAAAGAFMMDYRTIKTLYKPESKNSGRRKFLPSDSRTRHLQSRTFLESTLAVPFDGKTIVVTHHAPHICSIAPQYENDAVTPAFVSDMSDLISKHQPELWVHGHTHTFFDYNAGATRMVCNPRGYSSETTGFVDDFVVEL